ncbi:MAG: YHYH domain-containing protein [Moraxellaceae bacterium]
MVNHKRVESLKKHTISTVLSLVAGLAFAHAGGLDANRCHTNHKTGEYHCH